MATTDPGGKAPTLEQVAARAGVSRATASRVLRGSPRASESARTAVLTAASELAYAPNLAARSLATGRSGSVAFVVAETEDQMFADPFFLGLLRAAHSVLAESEVQLMFSVAHTEDDKRRLIRYASAGHVDGVLLLSLHGDSDLPLRLEAHGVPTVLSGRPLVGSERVYYVDSDNAAGAGLAARHLAGSGRRHIATITGPQDMSVGQDRLHGFVDALIELGRASAGPSASGGFTRAGGYRAMSALLSGRPDIDAVFAASDLMALGAMRAIQESGRRVPDDVAVIGFDDIDEAAISAPTLTTVRQPLAELGRRMAHRLLERVEGGAAQRTDVLDVELVRRQSA